MSIRLRLRLGIIFSILMLLVLITGIVISSGRINRLVNQARLVNETVRAAFELNSLTIDYMIAPSDEVVTRWNSRYSQMYIRINALEVDPGSLSLVASLRQRHSQMGGYFDGLQTNQRNFEKGQISVEVYRSIRNNLVDNASIELQEIARDAAQLSSNNNNNLLGTLTQLSYFAIGLMLVMAVFFMLVFRVLELDVIRPITSLTMTAQAISDGDLARREPETSADEIGTMARAFNQMTATLQNTMRGLEVELQERQRISSELQESEEKIHALFNAIPDTKFLFDEQGTFLEYIPNKDFLPLVPPEAFLGKKVDDVMPESIAKQLHDNIALAMKSGQVQVYEYCLPDENGPRYFESRVVDSGHNRILTVVREITERVQMLEQIEKMNTELEQRVIQRTAELQDTIKELGSFSYTISHDLRAPLRAMVGYTHIVIEEEGHLLSPESRKHLERVNINAKRMGTMVDELLAFSRLGRQSIQMKKISSERLHSMTAHIIAELREEYPNRVLDVRVGELPPCMADASLLNMVFINLLSNAFKYSSKVDMAIVEIGHELTARGPAYFIRDNGAGFDMKYADKLFGVFNRLHHPDEFEGTGVGLAIVHRIITRHGGQIWAEAEIGKGACFYFTLPDSAPEI